ncbi:hypothetical protein ACQWHW_26570, partial [Salmonella enterica subsp. enterica serovar Infantis]
LFFWFITLWPQLFALLRGAVLFGGLLGSGAWVLGITFSFFFLFLNNIIEFLLSIIILNLSNWL